MDGLELFEARKCELQMLNAILFARNASTSRSSLCSVFGVDAIHPLRLEHAELDVHLESGDIYPYYVKSYNDSV